MHLFEFVGQRSRHVLDIQIPLLRQIVIQAVLSRHSLCALLLWSSFTEDSALNISEESAHILRLLGRQGLW